MISAVNFSDLAASLVWLSMASGAAGALAVLLLLGLLRSLSDWYTGRCLSRQPFPRLGQSGRSSLPVLFWLSACAVAALAACASPENYAEKGSYSGHAGFIERAKAGW